MGKERLQKEMIDFDKFKKIHLGCGNRYLDNFLNIDIMEPADIICDAREGLPIPDETAEFIFSEHFLEHIDYPISAKKIIRECNRILKKGGKLVIGVPDAELIIQGYIKNDLALYNEMISKWYSKRDCLEHFNTYMDLVNYNLRDQDDSDNYTPHLWAYDFDKLSSLLQNASLKEIKHWKFNPSIANPKREYGSIYVSAKK